MSEYIIFDALNTKLCTAPFMAAKVILEKLFIANQTVQTEKKDFGFENYALNPKAFAENFALVLAQAGKNGEGIIALENSSFYSLQYAKNYIANNVNIKNEIEKQLNKFELTVNFLADVKHANKLLSTKNVIDNIAKNTKHTFDGFKTAVYVGSDLNLDFDINDDLNILLNTIKLSKIYFEKELNTNGYDIYTYAPEIALKMAGAVLADAYDSGADFIITNDIRAFYMFDTCRKKIEKAIGRQISLYVLTIPQVILLALGETNKKILGFNEHKVKPTILE
ncbi:MAG: hypothetical protein LBD84_04660 [Campylobacteraceae bacterium]|jgi:succinate dehydrogenase / fumarate reductase cytochrome b subunit|nr:hypothetical protein [Campylobacteraceae bacterium]